MDPVSSRKRSATPEKPSNVPTNLRTENDSFRKVTAIMETMIGCVYVRTAPIPLLCKCNPGIVEAKLGIETKLYTNSLLTVFESI